MSAMSRILSVGEALIDVVTRPDGEPSEHVGGSLLNVANGVAKLGHRSSICSWWGRDVHGALIAASIASTGAEVEPGTDSATTTSIAQATVDAEGRATYTFDLTWDLPEVRDLAGVSHVHTGSIGATLEPGGAKVVDLVARLRDTATVSYDPNIRPAIMGAPAEVLGRVEALVALSDVVKASDEDLDWLYPGVPVETVLRRWVDLGPALAVYKGTVGRLRRAANVARPSRGAEGHGHARRHGWRWRLVHGPPRVGPDRCRAPRWSRTAPASRCCDLARARDRPTPPYTARSSRARSRSATRARTRRRARRHAP
jgi:fructokinase